jgi:uncharacterized membrane protein YvlD (DUF360 family)
MSLTPRTADATGNLSWWWIILPTLVYAIVAQQLGNTLLVMAIGAALAYAQTLPSVPAGVRPFLPALQPGVVFLFLGGNPLMLAGVVLGIATIVTQRSRLVAALEPWWRVQETIPAPTRRIASFAVPFVIGFGFGHVGSGWEWAATLLSMTVGTAASFLLIFTPPTSLRRAALATTV